MNKEQKAAVIDEVAAQIADADAVLAIDYRGLSVTQAVALRTRLGEADASFRVVKNRLTSRALDKAGAESLKGVLEGPTAFAFVKGDAALAAKAVSTFRREHQLLAFKGGTLDGEPLTVEQIESIARLPGRDVLQGQFVGVLAAPVTGLVRGLASMIQGLALQLGQLQEQGLIGGEAEAAAEPEPAEQAAAEEATPAAEAVADEPTVAAEAAADEPAPTPEAAPDDAAAPDEPESAPDEPAPGGDAEETSTEAEASAEQSEASQEAEAKED